MINNIKNDDCIPKQNNVSTSEDSMICENCLILGKRLERSRNWNRFFKEKLINIDKLLHILSEFEHEKQKNLDLQLAYDQRSREWNQQQEQLITLLQEVQPLRERLKVAEDTAKEETNLRLKHQDIEESLHLTIQQLQAKIGLMHSKSNPVFVENLEKKLALARADNKKLRNSIECLNTEVAALRSYISSNHSQFEKLHKKFFWALQLAESYGRQIVINSGEDIVISEYLKEWDSVLESLEDVTITLQSLYSTYRNEQISKLKGRRLELTFILNFHDWIQTFDVKPLASLKEEIHSLDNIVASDTENEASELEKLINQHIFNKKLKEPPATIIKGMPTSPEMACKQTRKLLKHSKTGETQINHNLKSTNDTFSKSTRLKSLQSDLKHVKFKNIAESKNINSNPESLIESKKVNNHKPDIIENVSKNIIAKPGTINKHIRSCTETFVKGETLYKIEEKENVGKCQVLQDLYISDTSCSESELDETSKKHYPGKRKVKPIQSKNSSIVKDQYMSDASCSESEMDETFKKPDPRKRKVLVKNKTQEMVTYEQQIKQTFVKPNSYVSDASCSESELDETFKIPYPRKRKLLVKSKISEPILNEHVPNKESSVKSDFNEAKLDGVFKKPYPRKRKSIFKLKTSERTSNEHFQINKNNSPKEKVISVEEADDRKEINKILEEMSISPIGLSNFSDESSSEEDEQKFGKENDAPMFKKPLILSRRNSHGFKPTVDKSMIINSDETKFAIGDTNIKCGMTTRSRGKPVLQNNSTKDLQQFQKHLPKRRTSAGKLLTSIKEFKSEVCLPKSIDIKEKPKGTSELNKLLSVDENIDKHIDVGSGKILSSVAEDIQKEMSFPEGSSNCISQQKTEYSFTQKISSLEQVTSVPSYLEKESILPINNNLLMITETIQSDQNRGNKEDSKYANASPKSELISDTSENSKENKHYSQSIQTISEHNPLIPEENALGNTFKYLDKSLHIDDSYLTNHEQHSNMKNDELQPLKINNDLPQYEENIHTLDSPLISSKFDLSISTCSDMEDSPLKTIESPIKKLKLTSKRKMESLFGIDHIDSSPLKKLSSDNYISDMKKQSSTKDLQYTFPTVDKDPSNIQKEDCISDKKGVNSIAGENLLCNSPKDIGLVNNKQVINASDSMISLSKDNSYCSPQNLKVNSSGDLSGHSGSTSGEKILTNNALAVQIEAQKCAKESSTEYLGNIELYSNCSSPSSDLLAMDVSSDDLNITEPQNNCQNTSMFSDSSSGILDNSAYSNDILSCNLNDHVKKDFIKDHDTYLAPITNGSYSKIPMKQEPISSASNKMGVESKPVLLNFYKERSGALEEVPELEYNRPSPDDTKCNVDSESLEDDNVAINLIEESEENSIGVKPSFIHLPVHSEVELDVSYLNDNDFKVIFEHLLKVTVRTFEWNNYMKKLLKYITNLPVYDPNSKLLPFTRCVLDKLLCTDFYESSINLHSIPDLILKCLQISRLLERNMSLPKFYVDNLINMAAHRLILTKILRPNSLASLTCWFMNSFFIQYMQVEKEDENLIFWARAFLVDLLFHHVGTAHKALLTAINCSGKKAFIRMVKQRPSSPLESVIFWIIFHGAYIGDKITRITLIEDAQKKIGLLNIPEEKPEELFKTILYVLSVKNNDKDENFYATSAFLLILQWLSPSWITTSFFPHLQNIIRSNPQLDSKPQLDTNPQFNSLPLGQLKLIFSNLVNRGNWNCEAKSNFLQKLEDFDLET